MKRKEGLKTASKHLIMSALALACVLWTGCGKPADAEGKKTVKEQPTQAASGIPVDQREKGRLWCTEHNRYEDRCWLCHPEQQDKNRLFCKEHSLYEDECFLCHPELKGKK